MNWWEAYLDSFGIEPSIKPVIRFEGELLDWDRVGFRGSIWPSDIPTILNHCTYTLGLQVKYGEVESVSLEKEKVGKVRRQVKAKGVEKEQLGKDIERLEKALVEVRAVEGRRRETVDKGKVVHEGTRSGVRVVGLDEIPRLLYGQDSAKVSELPLRGLYGGLGVSGRVDDVGFLGIREGLTGLEVVERKTSRGGKVWGDHWMITRIYSYFLGEIFSVPVSYSLEVYDRDKVKGKDKTEQLAFIRSKGVEPSFKGSRNLDSGTRILVERDLDRVLKFFTGEVPCETEVSGGCNWCPFQYTKCPIYKGSMGVPKIEIVEE